VPDNTSVSHASDNDDTGDLHSHGSYVMLKRLFISHATEDKETVAKPLADSLIRAGFRVWYDEYSLALGDSLKGKIDEGLSHCDYAVVILSNAFFSKHWTREELDGLTSVEASRRRKVILPIWHGITFPEIAKHSPTLAGKLSISTEKGIEYLVNAITGAVNSQGSDSFVQRDDLERRTIHVAMAAAAAPASWDWDVTRIPENSWEEFGKALLEEMKRLDQEDKTKRGLGS
jgi:hypothetical protein